jgi:hypothetical protein
MGLLKALIILIIAWFIFSCKRETFCGMRDQCCRCAGYETFVNNEVKADIDVRGVQNLSGSDLSLIAAGY